MKKIFFFTFLFFLLVYIQTSFLVHFLPLSINLILILIIFLNLFQSPELKSGIILSLLGGLFLDFFSFAKEPFFGFFTLIFLFLSLFIKVFLKRYVQVPNIKELQ